MSHPFGNLLSQQTGKLAGAYLVSVWQDWPLIGSLAMQPDLRGHGLAGSLFIRETWSSNSNAIHNLITCFRRCATLGVDRQGGQYMVARVFGPMCNVVIAISNPIPPTLGDATRPQNLNRSI